MCDKKLTLLNKIREAFEKEKELLNKLPSLKNELGNCKDHKWENSK